MLTIAEFGWPGGQSHPWPELDRKITGGTELENTTGDPRLDRDPTPDRPVDR